MSFVIFIHYCFCGGILVAGIVLSLYGVSWIEYTRHGHAWLLVCFFMALGQQNVRDNIFEMLYLMVMSWRFMIASSIPSLVLCGVIVSENRFSVSECCRQSIKSVITYLNRMQSGCCFNETLKCLDMIPQEFHEISFWKFLGGE